VCVVTSVQAGNNSRKDSFYLLFAPVCEKFSCSFISVFASTYLREKHFLKRNV
jgi:hypothetical protein